MISQSLRQRKHGRSQLLDFNKAFDSVPLLILSKGKPESLEVSRQIIKDEELPEGRKKISNVGNVLFWNQGVPQRSVQIF